MMKAKVFFLLPILLVFFPAKVASSCSSGSVRTYTYSSTYSESYSQSYTYQTKCGWFDWGKCTATRHRTAYRTATRDTVRCCSGYGGSGCTDNVDPVIRSCPGSQSIYTIHGRATETATWTPPTASDNSGSQTLTTTRSPGASFGIGSTKVTYTSRDARGNTATCSFYIRVYDNSDPVITSCPRSQSKSTLHGKVTATATWIPPTASDNSGSQTLTTTHNPGASFGIGSTKVTYTSSDARGNTATCSFYIRVYDREDPVITACPGDQVVQTSSGLATAMVSWIPPTASDNSGSQTLTTTHSPRDSFPIGSTTVTYTSRDARGNTATCSFRVTVYDPEDPVITDCPGDQRVQTIIGLATATVSWIPPTASDNSGSQTLTTTHSPGASFGIGRTWVTYTSRDARGNTATCSFYIRVYDPEDPVITDCPGDQRVQTISGLATATVSWIPPTASDNSGSQNLTTTHSPGDFFPIGSTRVTYKSRDARGNKATCIFYIRVYDQENPEITGCPDDQFTNTSSGIATAAVNWEPPTASDNSGYQTLTSTHSPGDSFGVGSTVVIYTSTDAAGNNASCAFTIHISDHEGPAITDCPGDLDVQTSSGLATAIVIWIPPRVVDNSESHNLTSNHSPGESFDLGTTHVIYEATDAAGNTKTCVFMVKVEDRENPVLTGCPGDQATGTDSGSATATVSWEPPTASDNSGYQYLTWTHSPGDSYGLGSTMVTYTSTDAAGNTDDCSFVVFVFDSERPVISDCPRDVHSDTSPGLATAMVNWTAPTAADNSGYQLLIATHSPGDTFAMGSTPVSYSATDAAGNEVVCNFTVIVRDQENPVITGCPDDQFTNTSSGVASTTVSWELPTASDNSGYQTLTSTHSPGDSFGLGFTTVIYTSTDAAGNTDNCSFIIHVTDREDPMIFGCPGDQVVQTSSGLATAIVSWIPPHALDNSGTHNLTSSRSPGETFNLGTTPVFYAATDAAGNTETCTFRVVVIDRENPVITGCPGDQVTNTSSGVATATVSWEPPTASDNSGYQDLTSTHSPDDSFDLGSTLVTYTSTDASGNTDNCGFNIFVIDSEKPVISDCPRAVHSDTSPGLATAMVNWTAPTAADNSGYQTLIATHSPGDTFMIGSTSVNYTATDAAGNEMVCNFTVIVRDSESPVIIGCPADQSATTSDGMITATVSWVPPNTTDNSGSVTLTQTHNSGDTFSSGTTIVTYTSRDATGNMNTCSFNIAVTDVNECYMNPCRNGGTCINTIGSFSCDCPPGWSGTLCEMGFCASNPCPIIATCVPADDDCLCPATLTGINCDIPVTQDGIPAVIFSPRSKDVSLNNDVTLSCRVQNVQQFYWLKDGAEIPNTTDLLDYVIRAAAPRDEGYYSCVGKADNGEQIESSRAVVKIIGLSLFPMSIRILRQYTAALLDSTTTEYQTLASEITTILLPILGNTSPSSQQHYLHITGFTAGSVIVNVNAYIANSSKNTTDSVDFLHSAIALMGNETTFEVDLSSVTVKSADECFPVSWLSLYGIVHFEAGPLHTWMNSNGSCPWYTLKAGIPVARAFCSGDRISAAYWLPEDNCGGNITVDQQILYVEQLADVNEEPEVVLNLVVSITRESAQLTSSGVEATVGILEDFDNIQETTQENADAIVAVIGNLAAVDESQLETAQEETGAVSRATETLENILLNLNVSANETFREVEENVAVQVISVASDAASSGFVFASVGDVNQAFDDSSITQLSINDYQESYDDDAPRRVQTAVIVIPPTAVDGASGNNIVLTIYRDDALFVQNNVNSDDIDDDDDDDDIDHGMGGAIGRTVRSKAVINTNVIAASIGDRAQTSTKLSVPVNITLAHKQTNATNPRCMFWDYSSSAWSMEGCWLVHSHQFETGCSCDHLTNFAVLMDVHAGTRPMRPVDKIYTVLSYIGCSLSVVGLLATMAVYLSDRTLRRTQPNQILMCLCGSLLGLYISFLVMLAADRRRGEAELSRGACGFLASVLHFCSLSTFFWMGVEGANLYLMVVRVMNSFIPRFMQKAAVIAWGVPAIIVIVTGASANHQYAYTDYCFIRKWPLVGGLLVELALILAANAIIFGLVMYRLTRVTSASKKGKTEDGTSSSGTAMRRLQNAVIVLFLLGFTWVVGYLTVINDVNMIVHIIFIILNSLQGFFMFVLYALRLPKVRAWLAERYQSCLWYGFSLTKKRGTDNDHSVAGSYSVTTGTVLSSSAVSQTNQDASMNQSNIYDNSPL